MQYGYNLVIIADGASGTGKTYTMFNGPSAIATSLSDIFFHLFPEHSICVSIYEITKDGVTDHLKHRPLAIQRNKDLDPSKRQVNSAVELSRIIKEAEQNKASTLTKKNPKSTSGHFVCSVTIKKNNKNLHMTLIDLCGGKTVAEGTDKIEKAFINTSRMQLHAQIENFAEGRTWSNKFDSEVSSLLKYDLANL